MEEEQGPRKGKAISERKRSTQGLSRVMGGEGGRAVYRIDSLTFEGAASAQYSIVVVVVDSGLSFSFSPLGGNIF